MSTEQTPRSRRAVLAGAGAGLAAVAAAALTRPAKTLASNGDPVLVGQQHTGTATTTIENTTAQPTAAAIRGNSDSGDGLLGVSVTHNGVEGFSTSGAGLAGHSDTDAGVSGFGVLGVWATGTRYGVQGGSDGVGIFGQGHGEPSGTGVIGYSSPNLDPAQHPAAKAKTGVYGYAAQDSTSKGIYGESPAGWAGYFLGRLYLSKYQEMAEVSTPSAPGTNKARLFVRDNGSGKTQLCVRFPTGAVQVIKTEP